MTRVIVAAGGGGDAVAAAMLDGALYGGREPAVILTYAWERLIIDPLPGPRGPADFTGLRRLTPSVCAVPAGARPIAPAGSTLPRLAAELPHTFALIDPYHGVQGIARQLDELLTAFAPESVDLLDVGGDILARGDEPTLKSPLGDALTLAACAHLGAGVRLLVAGPGLDGEIAPDVLRQRLGERVHLLTAEQADAVGGVLTWHPSEATALLTAAARGVRGLCEIRDAGLAVPLTDGSTAVHEADLDDTFRHNELARRIVATTSLADADARCREVCGFSEIDYERAKARRLADRPVPVLRPDTVASQLAAYEAGARARGITHTTFRRLIEVLGYHGTQREELRSLLIRAQPGRYAPPLWSLADG